MILHEGDLFSDVRRLQNPARRKTTDLSSSPSSPRTSFLECFKAFDSLFSHRFGLTGTKEHDETIDDCSKHSGEEIVSNEPIKVALENFGEFDGC